MQIPPPADTLSFPTTRELLNPKFESYKLEIPSDPTVAVAYTLPGSGLKLRTIPDHARLSFAEVQARVRHNHLSAGMNGEVVYLDGEMGVIAITMGNESKPVFHRLIELPQPLVSSAITPIYEYPTALPLSGDRWGVSDGTGRLYIIRVDSTTPAWTAKLEASYELVRDGDLKPFRLHALNELAGGELVGLLSTSMVLESTGPSSSTRISASTTVFNYSFVALESTMEAEEIHQLSSRWQLRSHDLPSFVTFQPESQRYIIGAASALFDEKREIHGKGLQERKREVEGEDSEMSNAEASTSTLPTDESNPTTLPSIPKPPPFSWTQDKESVTLVFAVPSDTPTSSIRATFSRQFLSIMIGSAQSNLTASTIPRGELPHVSHKKLWDSIDPHTSVWTFDRDAEGRDSTYGLLSLHLEKANAGTRWSDVFATSPAVEEGLISMGEVDRSLEQVAETLDPSELAMISESMEKYTQSTMDATGGGEGEMGGNEIPTSLMGEEIDVEVDGESGRGTVITWIEDILSTTLPKLVRPHPTVPYSLLSLPIPFSSTSISATAPTPDQSIVIKHDVDGIRFTPASIISPSYNWRHTSTFPALAFVLATKRDASFVYHLSNQAVFAFDSPPNYDLGTTRSGAGNLFVYFNTIGTKDLKGRQWVLRVGGTKSGSLVGVAAIGGGYEGREGNVVLALCEKEVVVFKVV